MKHVHALVLPIVLALVALSCASRPATGGTKSEERQVDPFHSVCIAGSENLYVTQGDEQEVRIEADEEMLPNIKTKVRGGVLYVGLEDEGWFGYRGKIEVFVTMKEVRGLSVAGSGNIKGETPIQSKDLDLAIAGSGNIELNVTTLSISANIAGSGSMDLSGRCDRNRVTISGSGELAALDLNADEYDIRISGSGGTKVNVKESLDVRISGSGSVRYAGNPEHVNTDVSGSGSVKKLASAK